MTSTSKPIVLIVDDVPENLTILMDILSSQYGVKVARSGQRALQQAAKEPKPDLILLDVMMPEMDGYEVCRQLKANPELEQIPVIFVTALDEIEDEKRGFAVGGVDYIVKPIQPAIVKARTRTHIALRTVYRNLEEKSAVISEKNELLTYERGLVENIISRMRETDAFDPKGLRFLVSPLENTNGDMLLSASRSDGSQHVLVGDFTGHGLPAAIGGPMIEDIFYAMTGKDLQPEAILDEINKKLFRKLPIDIFLAGIFLDIDRSRMRLRAWNFGMPEILIWRNGTFRSEHPSTHSFLGIEEALDFTHCHDLDLQPEDRLFAFSDGVVERRGAAGEMFGMARTKEAIQSMLKAGHSLEYMLVLLEEFHSGNTPKDDITLVEITCGSKQYEKAIS